MARTIHLSSVVTMAKKKKEVDLNDNTKRLVDEDEMDEMGEGVLGSVYSLESFSTTDGPGICMAFFLQGCPKRCLFFCNPKTQALADPKKHPKFALSSGEVALLVGKYQEWLFPCGGSITILGGEPLIQASFVSDVFKRVQSLGLTTCLDTACHGDKVIWKEVLPHIDNILLCLNGMDNKVTGRVARVPIGKMAKSKAFACFV